MSRGACLRCGAIKADYLAVCAECGHLPDGEALAIAWLLSEENLRADELDGVAARVRDGEVVRPSERQLRRARRALGRDFHSDPGLGMPERLGILVCSLALTPLPGLAVGAWWWRTRPRAALQALALSAPFSVLWLVVVVWLRLG